MLTNMERKIFSRSLVSLTEYHLADFVSESLNFIWIGALAILANLLCKVIAFLLLSFKTVLD